MKKYKKDISRKRSILKMFIAILCLIIIILIMAFLYILVNNNITYVLSDNSAKDVLEDEAKNSTPIIVNNTMLGGMYDKKFVSLEKYYLYSINKKDFEITMYGTNGKIGDYLISSISKSSSNDTTVNVLTSKENLILEYYGLDKKNQSALNILKEVDQNDYDISVSKKALGLYRILNSSIKVSKVYEADIYKTGKVRLISITNEPKKGMGAYSALIAYDTYTGKADCIKYNYVRNKNKAQDFGIITLKFVCDLNSDGINELIVQDTKEFSTTYSIIEYRDGKYVKILSSTQKI